MRISAESAIDRASDASSTLTRPPLRQPAWRFLHQGRLEGWSSYRVRAALKGWAHARFQNWPLQDIALRTGMDSVTVSALNPAAGEWMLLNMRAMLEAIAEVCGAPLAVEPTVYTPEVRPVGRWLYEVPRLIVARSGRKAEWAPWRQEKLGDTERQALTEMIFEGLRHEFDAWGIPYGALGKMFLVDEGRPMVIAPTEGPRVLARLGVKFVADGALDGDLFIGKLTALGYGWIRRGGQLPDRQEEAAGAKEAPEGDSEIGAARASRPTTVITGLD